MTLAFSSEEKDVMRSYEAEAGSCNIGKYRFVINHARNIRPNSTVNIAPFDFLDVGISAK